MPDSPRVFISYARSDGETFAAKLRARLEREEPEITLWQDRARLEGGKGWWPQIVEALDAVQFMVLVMTPAALASSVVRKEWQAARQRGVCVYPVVGSEDLDFAKMPKWMADAHFYHLEKEWETFVNYLKAPCDARRVPFMPAALPAGYVARPSQLNPLLNTILTETPDGELDDPSSNNAAFFGPGGFGKTTLATALCHHDGIITAYDAGVLWVTLGENPNVLNELTKLHAVLTGERPGFVDEQDASLALAQILDEGSYLLVIDDVWEARHLRPFLRGGPNCARLVTTRQFEIASTLDARVGVDEMTSDEAVQMLTGRLDEPPPDLRPFRKLAARLGEWPLLLELARDVLGQRLARKATLDGALDYLNTALDRKGVVAFDRRNSDERNAATGPCLQVSLDLLDEDEEQRYRELAIFPDDVDVPLSALAALWDIDEFDAEQTVERLAELSLLAYDLPNGSIRLHNVIRAFLASQLDDPAALHARLVDGWGDLHALPDAYAWRWIGHHMVAAKQDENLRQLLLDFTWLDAKLRTSDANALVADCERLPEDEATRRLGSALRRPAHVLSRDPNQLAPQLLGRLRDAEIPQLQSLLDVAARAAPRPALLPASASLREQNALIRTLQGHTGSVRSVAVTPDGGRAIAASFVMTLKVWDIESGEEERTLQGHTGSVRSVAVTPDGRGAIAASFVKTLKVWDIESGDCIATFVADGTLFAIAGSPDGHTIVAGGASGRVHFLRLVE